MLFGNASAKRLLTTPSSFIHTSHKRSICKRTSLKLAALGQILSYLHFPHLRTALVFIPNRSRLGLTGVLTPGYHLNLPPTRLQSTASTPVESKRTSIEHIPIGISNLGLFSIHFSKLLDTWLSSKLLCSILDDTAAYKMASSMNSGTSATAGLKRKRDAGPKFYAVRVGRKPGIYHNWDDCLAQVKGFKDATCEFYSRLCDQRRHINVEQSNPSLPLTTPNHFCDPI